MSRLTLAVSSLFLAAMLAACDSSAPGAGGQVSFNVAVGSPGSSAGSDSMVDGSGNVLVLTRVELVLRDIEFERQNRDACDSVTTGDSLFTMRITSEAMQTAERELLKATQEIEITENMRERLGTTAATGGQWPPWYVEWTLE